MWEVQMWMLDRLSLTRQLESRVLQEFNSQISILMLFLLLSEAAGLVEVEVVARQSVQMEPLQILKQVNVGVEALSVEQARDGLHVSRDVNQQVF